MILFVLGVCDYQWRCEHDGFMLELVIPLKGEISGLSRCDWKSVIIGISN